MTSREDRTCYPTVETFNGWVQPMAFDFIEQTVVTAAIKVVDLPVPKSFGVSV